MSDGFKEVCVDCKFHQAGKRELVLFKNGNRYMVTGVCTNERSILHKIQVAGNLTPRSNVIYRMLKLIDFKSCFVQR